MSWVLLKIFRSLLPPFAVPPSLEIGISGSVLLFAMATTAAAGLIFGCVPAWRFARRNSSEALKQSSRAGFMNGRHRLGQALVIAEFALALTLLMGGGMVLRRYWSRTHLDLGVRTQNILTFEIPRRRGQFQTPEQAGQYSRILMEKLQAVPGVIRVSTCDPLPLAPGWGQAMFVAARRRPIFAEFPSTGSAAWVRLL